MLTLSTHQTIGLTSTTYAVTTDDGQHLGAYQQDHGADVVTSADLPAGDNGIVGPVEAIAHFTTAAGIKGWRLSENITTACSPELTEDVTRRVDALGGLPQVHLGHVCRWADELGLQPSQLLPALMDHDGRLIAA